jgi:hypothetical protein
MPAYPPGFTPDGPEGFTPDAPQSTGTRLYQDYVAKPLTNVVGRGLEAIGNVGVPLARMAQGESVRESFNPRGIIDTLGAGGVAADTRRQAAEVVVPQTPLQAGIMAGTAAAGPASRALPALAKFPALSRILGGTVGGAAGGAVEDPTASGALSGAAWGAGTTAAGEVAGKALSWLGRVGPGGKGAMAAQDAATYGQEMGRGSPPLAGAKTVQDLKALAEKTGRPALGASKEQAVQQIEGMTGNAPVVVPALGPTPMTLREANDQLTAIGEGAFNQHILDRTAKKAADRKLYGQVSQEIEAALGPQAGPLFRAAQDEYKKGLAYLRPLQAQNAYRLQGSDMQFNTPAIQRMIQNPRNAAAMGNKMGSDYDALKDAMTRGAGQGQDMLATGRGGMGSAIMQWLRGGNTGFWGLPSAVLRSAAPNIGSQYAGNATLKIPPALQQILDMVAQRQAGQIGQ